MASWVLTESATLPSQITAAGTNSEPPTGAISVPTSISVVAVCNPAAYILNSKEVTRQVPQQVEQDGKKVMEMVDVTETEYFLTPAPLTLSAAKLQQRALIKQSFTAAANANVTDANGVIWEGGMSSGNSIFLACQLAQQTNQTNITLYDASKKPHSMTVAEGMAVASLIGEAYQKALGTKNSLYANIDAASTVSAVQKITWPS
ncbi:MAG: hypothetical protein K0041_08810 [Acidithiobacillus sp.]|nr:hypothetical protein [Acidithiobacillus sp.]